MMDIPPCPDALENQFKKEWKDADPELQGEFLEDFELYRAYCWARERGAIKYKLGYDGDLEKINKIQQRYYSDTKSVKTLAKVVNAKTVKMQTCNAGKQSANRRRLNADAWRVDCASMATDARKRNARISVPQIADKFMQYIEENDSEYDFLPKISTVKTYLRSYLKEN